MQEQFVRVTAYYLWRRRDYIFRILDIVIGQSRFAKSRITYTAAGVVGSKSVAFPARAFQVSRKRRSPPRCNKLPRRDVTVKVKIASISLKSKYNHPAYGWHCWERRYNKRAEMGSFIKRLTAMSF